MARATGRRVLFWCSCRRMVRRGQKTPKNGSHTYWVGAGALWFRYEFLARKGWQLLAIVRGSRLAGEVEWESAKECLRMPPKRRGPPMGEGRAPALPDESKALSKCPALREFLSATAYEDGGKRQPGYITLRNRGQAYEITLYDPDAGARISVRGPTIDHCFSLAEQLLGVEEAPWEEDRYLTSLLTGKKKKR